jgi:putative transcriptional regulator
MSTIKSIRERLGVTQSVLATGIGCTQGNIGHYERGQTVPPDMAKRLIEYAGSRGCVLTFNDIYIQNPAQAPAKPAQAATESVATQGASHV